MIRAPANISTEFVRRDAMFRQISACLSIRRDRAARRDVISGHVIAEQKKDARSQNWRVGTLLAIEKWRPTHEHAIRIPGVHSRGAELNIAPARPNVGRCPIGVAKHIFSEGFIENRADF